MFGNFLNKHNNRYHFRNQRGGAGSGRGRGNTSYGLGYSPPTQDEDITTKLFSIIETGNYQDINEAITSNSYDPKVFNDNGESIVHVLLNNENTNLSTKNIINILRLLKTHNVAMNNRDKRGLRPLHLASKMQNNDLIKFFLKEDTSTNVNVADINGQTPLHYAIRGKIIEVEPVDEPEEEEFKIPKSISNNHQLETKAYELKKDYIINFFNKRGVFLDDNIAETLAVFIIEGHRVIDDEVDMPYELKKEKIIERFTKLQTTPTQPATPPATPPFKLQITTKLDDKYFNALIFAFASKPETPNSFNIGKQLDTGDPDILKKCISLSDVISNFMKMKGDLDIQIKKIIQNIHQIKNNFYKYGSKNGNSFKKGTPRTLQNYKLYYYNIPDPFDKDSVGSDFERDNIDINIKNEGQIKGNSTSGESVSKSIEFEKFIGYTLDKDFALKDLQVITLYPNPDKKKELLNKFTEEVYEKYADVLKQNNFPKNRLKQHIELSDNNIITSSFKLDNPIPLTNTTHALNDRPNLTYGNLYYFIKDFINDFTEEFPPDAQPVVQQPVTDNVKRHLQNETKDLEEILKKIICDKIGLGELEEDFRSTIKSHFPQFQSTITELGNQNEIYISNNQHINIHQASINPKLYFFNQLIYNPIPNFSYNDHPKLSTIGTDIFRYVGLCIRKYNPKYSIDELVQKTIYTVVINCLFYSNVKFKRTNSSFRGRFSLSYELTNKFVFENDTLPKDDNIKTIIGLLNKQTNALPDIQIKIDGNEQTIIDYYSDRKQSTPENKIIESIIPFGKVTGMLTQPVDIKSLNKHLYNIQTKETVLKEIKKQEIVGTTTDIFDIVTNVDMYTSDHNIFKVNKFLQVDAGLTKNLLKRRCNINAIDKFDRSPLHYAISYLGIDVIKMLLEKKAYIFTPAKNSPYDFYITSFENYCKPLEDLLKIEGSKQSPYVDIVKKRVANHTELKYIGLWEPILDAMKEENNEATLDVFQYLLEEFIRNINRHIIFPGISLSKIMMIYDFVGIDFNLKQISEHHLLHRYLTNNLLKIIKQMKMKSWVKNNVLKSTSSGTKMNLLDSIDNLIKIYKHILYEKDLSVGTDPKYLELIGIVDTIDNTDIKLIALYPDHELKDDELVFYDKDQTKKAKYNGNNLNTITIAQPQITSDHLKLDQNNKYLYKIVPTPTYKLREYHDIIVERSKDGFQTDKYKSNISNENKVIDKILNRIVKFTINNIIDTYILDYDLCELFVSYLWGISEEIKKKKVQHLVVN